DSVETEERDWADLEKLDTGEHALWWQLTAEFLRIASAFWPARLEELRRSSPARHQAALLRGEARRMAEQAHKGPVIVAGSTGSVPATADLIAAIAALPEGSVVLPGLDLTEADWWTTLSSEGPDGRIEPSSRSHPQFGLARLLRKLDVDRSEVEVLGTLAPDLAYRAATLSHAMAPAAATDQWNSWRASAKPEQLHPAFAEVALIEAANER